MAAGGGRGEGGGRVVVTVTGRNRPGIVAAFSKVLAAGQVDIVDMSQKLLDEELFVMMIVANLEGSRTSLGELRQELKDQAEHLGLQLSVHHEKLFRYLNRV
jgi:ACT domain-containing protein